MPPVLSIIIPCHNVAQNFAAAGPLTAIHDGRVEVLFVDDGSTDGTPRVLKELELAVAKTVVSSANHGPGAARNLGLEAAQGDYVWFVDADDRPVPGPVLGRMAEIERLNPDVVIFQTVCGGRMLDSSWSETADMFERLATYGRLTSKLFNRVFLERHRIRFADAYASEDNAFLLQAAELQSSTKVYDDVIYEVVLSEGSITRGPFSPAYLSRWRAVKHMLDFARSHPRHGLRKLERDLVFLSISLTWSYCVERGRTAVAIRLMPRMLATLRSWGLARHLDVFLSAGSPKNRAVKIAAVTLAWPLSLMVKPLP